MRAIRKALAALAILPSISLADGEFVEVMAQLQYFAHKTNLSIEHKNKPLLEFYAHELEEYMEEAASIKSYDGFPVGKLVESMLVPSFENFEATVKKGDWKKISQSFDEVITSCNSCHASTEHGFINIERSSENPYMQSFKPAANQN